MLTLELNGQYRVRIDRPVDLSVPVRFDGTGERAFGLPAPVATAVPGVASCRCETVTLTPHGNGTHTECVAHVTRSEVCAIDEVPQGLMLATLMTGFQAADTEAVVVRTGLAWGGTKPAVPAEFAARLRAAGVRHLIVDLPSVDPENDEGRLAAHHAFFGGEPGRTITELAHIPEDLPDGLYLLDLQVAPLRLDAAPSRPILYPLEPR